MKSLYIKSFALSLSLLLTACTPPKEKQIPQNGEVQPVGAMMNVMRKGELGGVIHLDTLADKPQLIGLGPLEYLRGEVLLLDGKAYTASVSSDSTMAVQEGFDVKAPFFVYQKVQEWQAIALQDSIRSLEALEQAISQATSHIKKPFGFKLVGMVEEASIHIVNLPEGTKVSSPKEAHQGLTSYELADKKATLVGFYSTQHQGVFTHHSTNMHIHLITEDRSMMGHLDAVSFENKGLVLYVPADI